MLAIQAARVVAQRQGDGRLVVSAAGLVMVLVGLGVLARGRVRPEPCGWLLARLLGLWAFGENLVIALVCVLLGGCAYLLIDLLATGGGLTGAVADQTVHRVLALIFDVAQGR
jgi:hypothetical protein